MKADSQDLRARTRRYALSIIRLYERLPKTTVAQTIGRQILRSGTSPGAQYREAHRAKSTPDFVSKVEGALQELDETSYWLELLVDAEVLSPAEFEGIDKETEELIAIFVSIVKTAKQRG
jgi:four helix bundle protein